MPKRVVDVGNCSPDHSSIVRLLKAHFDVQVIQCHELSDTLAEIKQNRPDLVLINRKLDIDYSDGLVILKAIKSNPDLKSIPVMLISNYEEHQQTAVACGAIPGFGKKQYQQPQTLERLTAVLAG